MCFQTVCFHPWSSVTIIRFSFTVANCGCAWNAYSTHMSWKFIQYSFRKVTQLYLVAYLSLLAVSASFNFRPSAIAFKTPAPVASANWRGESRQPTRQVRSTRERPQFEICTLMKILWFRYLSGKTVNMISFHSHFFGVTRRKSFSQ